MSSSDLSRHLELALDAGGLGTWRWNMQTGETVWDARLEAIYGLEPGAFPGTFEAYVERLHPDDRDDVLARVRDAIERRAPYEVQHRTIWPDGTVHWVAGTGNVTLDDEGNVTGTIGCVADATARIERELERRRLADLAAEAADAERRQRDRLELITAVNDALAAARDVDDVLRGVTAAAVPRLGGWSTIHVLEPPSRVPRVVVAHRDPAMIRAARDVHERFPFDPDGDVGVARVIRTGRTEFVPEIDPQDLDRLGVDARQRAAVEALGLRSVITVALRKRGRVLGAMQFMLTDPTRRHTRDDVALAEALASRIAASLENHRLNAEQRHIAQTLQRSLLPATIPDIAGLDIAVRYSAAGEGAEVGGDFYDVLRLDDRRTAIVIGDVCGTGPEAAALTGVARQALRTATWYTDDPCEVLGAVNRAILETASRSFATAALAIVDLGRPVPTLTVASGGHPFPVLLRDGVATPVGAVGTLLGMFEDATVEPVTVDLRCGDALVFYTDGATDLPDPHGLTLSELLAIVEHAPASSADELADGLRDRFEERLPFAERHDDLALLTVRVAGSRAV